MTFNFEVFRRWHHPILHEVYWRVSPRVSALINAVSTGNFLNRNPTKCEIETYDETYDRLVTSKLQTTQMQKHLRAAAEAAASNKGLFT